MTPIFPSALPCHGASPCSIDHVLPHAPRIVNAPCIYFLPVHYEAMISKSQIRAARKRLKLSQAEFAKHFRVNQSTVHRWENGTLVIEGITEIGVEAVLADLSVQASRAAE